MYMSASTNIHVLLIILCNSSFLRNVKFEEEKKMTILHTLSLEKLKKFIKC